MDAIRFSVERNRLDCQEAEGTAGREELEWIICLSQERTEVFNWRMKEKDIKSFSSWNARTKGGKLDAVSVVPYVFEIGNTFFLLCQYIITCLCCNLKTQLQSVFLKQHDSVEWYQQPRQCALIFPLLNSEIMLGLYTIVRYMISEFCLRYSYISNLGPLRKGLYDYLQALGIY